MKKRADFDRELNEYIKKVDSGGEEFLPPEPEEEKPTTKA